VSEGVVPIDGITEIASSRTRVAVEDLGYVRIDGTVFLWLFTSGYSM
jgi:hypothetical protein